MKIGFSANLLEKKGSIKIKKDSLSNVKKAVLNDELEAIIRKLRDNNHESYIFFTTSAKLSLTKVARIKRQILKKYKLDKKYAPRIVIIDQEQYEESMKRNGISIKVDEQSVIIGTMEEYIDNEVAKRTQPILSPITKSCGTPSQDEFWKKYHTLESYKLINDWRSPYERIVSGNIDFLEENFLYSSEFGTKMTYKEAFDKADELCRVFMKMGVKKGSKVPLILTPTPDMLVAILALWKAKATIVPLFPKSTKNEIKVKLEGIDYDFMIVNDIFYGSVEDVVKPTSKAIILPVTQSANPIKRGYFNIFVKPKLGCKDVQYNEQFIKYDDLFTKYLRYDGDIDTSFDPDYEAVQLFTGGTVKSKGVILTAQNLEAAYHGYPIAEIPVLRDDKFAAFLPINHVFGLVSILYSATAYGGKISTMLKPDFKRMDKMFLKDEITVFAGVPTMVNSIITNKKISASSLKKLRYFILGGAKTDEKTKQEVVAFGKDHECESLKLIDGLGQTEVSTAYLYNNIVSVGCKIKIVNPETQEEVGYGESGEICVCGPNVMKGYTSEEDNARVFEKDAQGNVWFHTGDLGYNIDGKIYYSGRLNRRIKVNGELICVEDLEELISKCNLIKSCCIVGKAEPQKGTVPVAFVTLKDGYSYTETVEKELQEYYAYNLPPFARPAITKYLEELPKTALGKPDFKQLQHSADCMDFPKTKTKII